MGETDLHIGAIIRHREILRRYFAGQQVYVSGNLLVYYVQGDPKKFVVPDTFVVKGVSPGDRRTFKIWVERKVPNIVIETTSRKTRKKDVLEKSALYASLGVREYFLFDPDFEYLDPPLQGHRLVGAAYEQMVPDENGALVSEELGLRLFIDEERLQFRRLDTGQRLLTDAEARAEAEAEVTRLREELARRSPQS